MEVFRIAKRKWINELSGEGARLNGGRWNKTGSNVVYTSENRALAALEYLVGLPVDIVPDDVAIAEIMIPDEIEFARIPINILPAGWFTYPAPPALADIGEDWLTQKVDLLLGVPSAVVSGEWNILINPNHGDFSHVVLKTIEPYRFDPRLRFGVEH